MSDCECLPICPFFNERMADMPVAAAMLKQRFCRGAWETCARHRVFAELGVDGVPTDLFPDQDEVAEEILLGSRHI